MAKTFTELEKGFLETPDDLSQLNIIDATSVRQIAKDANSLTAEDLGSKKLVVLLATGGTLAMKTETGIRLPVFGWQKVFRPAEGLLRDRYKILGLNAFCLDSSQMDYGHAREMAITLTYLWKNIKVPFLGFLITHGTDTMSYAGAAMSLMAGQGLPFSVVYTGSQRPVEDPMSDAAFNLRNALCTLEALHDNDMAEVVIVMGDRAMLATSAEKVDDAAANAFDAPRHLYVSNFSRLTYPVPLAAWLNPRRKVPFAPTLWFGDYVHTLVIKSTMGLNSAMLKRQVEDADVHAVILYSYGAGTVHETVLQTVLDTAKKENIPVFIVNPVNADYRAEYKSAAHAIKWGAIPLNMTLSAALAKIEIALRLHLNNLPAVAHFMTENYVGEIPTNHSSSSSRKA